VRVWCVAHEIFVGIVEKFYKNTRRNVFANPARAFGHVFVRPWQTQRGYAISRSTFLEHDQENNGEKKEMEIETEKKELDIKETY